MPPYLPLGAAIAAAAAIGWRVVRHRRRYGSTGIVALDAANWRGRMPEIVLIGLATLLLGEAITWAMWPGALRSLVVMPPRAGWGAALVGLGLAVVVRAQIDLGR